MEPATVTKKKAKKRKHSKTRNSELEENITTANENSLNIDEEKVQDIPVENSSEPNAGVYIILGGNEFNKKHKVKESLPKWVLDATTVSASLQNLTTKVSGVSNLDSNLKKKLKAKGIKYLFPVQAAVIPYLLQSNKHSNMIIPRDVCVCAPTGSGKTLAFVIPVVQALQAFHVRKIRALAILPTQDLAAQVYSAFSTYTGDTHLTVGLLTGNCLFDSDNQTNDEISDAVCYDIVVCTPGRLVDYIIESKVFDLQYLKFLIIDEADRIMDNMQNDWLHHLEKHMLKNENNHQFKNMLNLFALKHKPIQKLLFSATLSLDPEKLTQISLFQPKLFTCDSGFTSQTSYDGEGSMGKYTLPEELTEKFIECPINLKPLAVYKFIIDEGLTRILIFTNSGEETRRLAILLQAFFKKKLHVVQISAKLESNHRTNLIRDFVSGKTNIIVCTDSLARGIDLPNVQCVISYTIPKHFTTYVHRVGRTARAGEFGVGVTLVSAGNKKNLTKLSKGRKSLEEVVISEESLQELSNKYEKALRSLKKNISKTEDSKLQKMMSAKRYKMGKSVKNINK